MLIEYSIFGRPAHLNLLYSQVLLSAGADIDTEDENGDTPFVHAFRGRHTVSYNQEIKVFLLDSQGINGKSISLSLVVPKAWVVHGILARCFSTLLHADLTVIFIMHEWLL